MRDHGGNLDAAIATFGAGEWLDLSTGINPMAYPLPVITDKAWQILPTRAGQGLFVKNVAQYLQTEAEIVSFSGAQGAIQAMPFLIDKGQARILGPTYNEHLAAFLAAGWSAVEVSDFEMLSGADLAVVVNPNNPTGSLICPDTLLALSEKVGTLVVDESFIDTCPEMSLCRSDLPRNVVVLRSFGKFFGLAGVRLGWAVARGTLAQKLKDRAGPWPVSGPAIEIATAALQDQEWHRKTRARLACHAGRMDKLAKSAGWELVGGTDLFRTYETPNSTLAQEHLANDHIWTRIFPYSSRWIRLGLPETSRFGRLEDSFRALSAQI